MPLALWHQERALGDLFGGVVFIAKQAGLADREAQYRLAIGCQESQQSNRIRALVDDVEPNAVVQLETRGLELFPRVGRHLTRACSPRRISTGVDDFILDNLQLIVRAAPTRKV